MQYNYLSIEGNIGSGKTTLGKILSEHYDTHLILEEFSENPFLAKFYENQERYAFQLELFFMSGRYEQMKAHISDVNLFEQKKMISDYVFSKSLLFAGITLGEQEFKLFRKLFSIIYTNLPKPDLTLYLWNDIDNLLFNIQKRGREYEKNIQADYLEKIQSAYLNYFKHHHKGAYLILDISDADFVKEPAQLQKIFYFLEEDQVQENQIVKL